MSTTNGITLELTTEQIGEIKVHSQIINDLSSGIYSSPASCIKELINNSFDADAHNVVIRMKPIEDTITIWDDGCGMNAKDFDENFAWISKSNKRKRGEFSPSGRPLIGKIGIGFIAVNEICEILEVSSSKKGEPIKFTATIDFSKITNSEVSTGPDDDTYLKGEFTLTNEEEDKREHYTSIRLVGLREPVLAIFRDETYKALVTKSKTKRLSKLEFKTMKDLLNYHTSRSVYSWENDTEYMQFVIDLASYIPVEYIDGGPIEGVRDTVISKLVARHRSFEFKVDFDGIYLKKPIFFPNDPTKRTALDTFKKTLRGGSAEDTEITLTGYFFMQNSLLIPRELNGLAVRIKNIPIAERFGFDGTFLRYPIHTDQLFRNWISGEVYVDTGLEEAMNIDRKSFRVTHPQYLALQNFVHEYLRQTIFKKVLKLYEEGREVREEKSNKDKNKVTRKILRTSKVTYANKSTKATSPSEVGIHSPIRIIQARKDEAIVEIDTRAKARFKRRDWDYLETIFIIFESAYKDAKGNAHKLRELFYRQINEWKAKE